MKITSGNAFYGSGNTLVVFGGSGSTDGSDTYVIRELPLANLSIKFEMFGDKYHIILVSTEIFDFMLEDVENQPTWTDDLAGYDAMQKDIQGWMQAYAAGGGGITGTVSVSNFPADQEVSSTSIESLLASAPMIFGEPYASPHDFTAAYDTTSTLLLTGSSQFTFDDASCYIALVVVKNASNVSIKYVNGHNGVSLYFSAKGTLKILGATPFASGDLAYRVVILQQRKGYDPSTDTNKATEQAPLNAKYVQDVLVNGTVASGSPNYYPSTTGMSMDGFKDLVLSGYIVEGDNVTDTIEVQVTNHEAPTVDADWFTVYAYNMVSNTWVNIITTGGTAGTYTYVLKFDDLNLTFFRVKLTTADATNTIVIRSRRKAL